ncbi:MAG: MFS transporter [Dehalococcoidia bacterium]
MTDRTRAGERSALPDNVWKFYIFSFLGDFGLTAPIWVLYLRDERGFSLTQITLMEVPLFLLMVFAEIPTGAVADRFGRKVSLMLGSALFAVSAFVIGTATSYPVIVVANVVWGLAFTFRSGANTALLYDSLKQAGREDDFQSINGRMWALHSAAMLSGLLLGAPIAAATSFTFVYVLSGLAAGCGALVALWMHEPEREPEPVREGYLRTLASGVGDAWRSPSLRYISVFAGIMGPSAAVFLLLFLQPWLDGHGIDTASLGVWQAPITGVQMLSALAVTWVVSRLGERGTFLALPVLLFGFGAAIATVDATWIAVAFLGIAVVRGLYNPALSAYINRRIESRRRATILSAQNVIGSITMATIWPLAGVATDVWSLQTAFFAYALGTLVLGGAAFLLWDRAERDDAARGGELRVDPVPVA